MIKNIGSTTSAGAYWGANATAIRGRWTLQGARVYTASGTALDLNTNLTFFVAAWL